MPPWLETGSGLKGLESYYSAVSTCSQVCTQMHTPAVATSTLELVPLPPKSVHRLLLWQYLPLLWSEAGSGPRPVLFPPGVHTLLGNGCLHLSGDQCRRGDAGAGAQCGLEGILGDPGKQARTPGIFQSVASTVFPGVRKTVCTLSKNRFWVPYSSLVSPSGSQTNKGACLPGVRLQGWHA